MKSTCILAYRVDLPLFKGTCKTYKWSGGKSVSVFDRTIVAVETAAVVQTQPPRGCRVVSSCVCGVGHRPGVLGHPQQGDEPPGRHVGSAIDLAVLQWEKESVGDLSRRPDATTFRQDGGLAGRQDSGAVVASAR